MQSRTKSGTTLLLMLTMLSCSGTSTLSRTSSQENNDPGSPSSAANSQSQAGAGNFTPSKNDEALPPVSVAGGYLIEVSANCVGIRGETTPSCREVRLSSTVKVKDAEPVRFAADTLKSLAIETSSWEIGPLDGVICVSTGSGFNFNPKCSSANSLASTVIKATLTLIGTDGRTDQGDSPTDKGPTIGAVVGNFMKVAATSGFKPSEEKYSGNNVDGSAKEATSSFSEIWQDLASASGLYLTNILYDGTKNTVDWAAGDDICRHKVNSGDGAGKWHLPTGKELCGSGFVDDSQNGNICPGGLYGHGIKNATFAGGDWSSYYFWSASPASSGSAWVVNLSGGSTGSSGKIFADSGVFCVR